VSDTAVSGSVSVLELDVGRHRRVSLKSVAISTGTPVTIGRDTELPVGIDPPDLGVSRRGVEVTAAADGWHVVIENRAGAFVHPWAQPPIWAPHGTVAVHRWPKIGIRLIGSDRTMEHWVLLESEAYPLPVQGRSASADFGPTRLPPTPKPLTAHQLAAVQGVFQEFLAWPPKSGPSPTTLATAATKLKISPAGVTERLARVQDRAYALGMHRQTGVSDPAYLYLLVRHGFITAPLPGTER